MEKQPQNTLDDDYWQEIDQALLERIMSSMGFGQSALAKRLKELAGDRWEEKSCLRAIQRVKNGENKMSPALRMVLVAMDRDWRRAKMASCNAIWEKRTGGVVHTTARGFSLSLIPQINHKWKVNLEHLKTKYSPSWIEWQDDLEIAKIRAFVQLDDTWLDMSWPGSKFSIV